MQVKKVSKVFNKIIKIYVETAGQLFTLKDPICRRFHIVKQFNNFIRKLKIKIILISVTFEIYFEFN